MPILHLTINGNQDNLVLDRTIHAQQLTLKRVVVRKNVSVDASGSDFTDYNGGILIFLPNLLTGFEINTNRNTGENGIPVYFPDTALCDGSNPGSGNPSTSSGFSLMATTVKDQSARNITAIYDVRYDMNFSQFEDIPENIQTKIMCMDAPSSSGYTSGGLAPFTVQTGHPRAGPINNYIASIDLFFEYAEVVEYDTY